MACSLYERCGGKSAIDVAVDRLHRKVLADDALRHFFDGVDMERLATKQKMFLTMVLGGPEEYSGRNLRDAHAGVVARGLNDSHFDALAGHLRSTLEELDVAADIVGEVMTFIEATRDHVLNR